MLSSDVFTELNIMSLLAEAEGEALISCDEENNRLGPAEAEAYAQIVEYLEQFVE